MKRLTLIGGLVIGLLSTAVIADSPNETEVVTIPLDEIRIGSPGSRELRDLESELFIYRDTPEKWKKYSTPESIEEIQQKAAQHSLVLPIEKAMRSMAEGVKVGSGFAVEGTDRAALQGVYDVLVKGNEPNNRFNAGTELSIIFYTRPAQRRVRLEQVQRRDGLIEIRYKFIPHGRMHITWNLALIPIGKLPPGEYRVEMVRSSGKEVQPNQLENESQIVCRPFSFEVIEQP